MVTGWVKEMTAASVISGHASANSLDRGRLCFRRNDGMEPDESGFLQQLVTPHLIRVSSVPVTPGEDPGSMSKG
jgi:hypothetical protein